MAGIKTIKYKFVNAVQFKKLKKAADLAFSRFNQFPALIISIDNRFTELTNILLDGGWDVNETRQKDGFTPLHSAVAGYDSDMITELLKRGANKDILDGTLLTPLARILKMRVCGKGLRVYHALTEGMAREEFSWKNQRDETLLHIAARNRTVPHGIYEELIEKGVDLNSREEFFGRCFLMDLTIFNGDQTMVIRIAELAIKNGLELNLVDHYGNSLLHRMASEERIQVLKWASQNPNFKIRVRNASDQTAMWLGTKRGNVEIIKILYSMGETVQDEAMEYHGCGYRRSLIQCAEYRDRKEVVEIIKREIEGEKTEEGNYAPKRLSALAKGVIRECLAKQGVNIIPKVAELELPKSLKEFVLELV